MDDKTAYRQKIEARLEQWNAEINKLQAKALEASADARIEYENLREKQNEARRTLRELDDVGGDALEDVKSGVEKAWSDLEAAMKRARERFG